MKSLFVSIIIVFLFLGCHESKYPLVISEFKYPILLKAVLKSGANFEIVLQPKQVFSAGLVDNDAFVGLSVSSTSGVLIIEYDNNYLASMQESALKNKRKGCSFVLSELGIFESNNGTDKRKQMHRQP